MFLCFCFSVKIPFSFSLKRRNSSVICLYLESRGLFYFRPVSPHRKLPFCFRQVHTGECDGGALQPLPHPLQDGSTSRRVHPSSLVICPLRGHWQTPLNLTLFILFEKKKRLRSPICRFPPHMPATAGPCRSNELNLFLPCGYQGPNYLDHHWLPLRVPLTGNWN